MTLAPPSWYYDGTNLGQPDQPYFSYTPINPGNFGNIGLLLIAIDLSKYWALGCSIQICQNQP